MQATQIYRKLDKLSLLGEYQDPRDLLHLSKRAYQSAMKWEVGELRDSYFNEFLNKLIDRQEKQDERHSRN